MRLLSTISIAVTGIIFVVLCYLCVNVIVEQRNKSVTEEAVVEQEAVKPKLAYRFNDVGQAIVVTEYSHTFEAIEIFKDRKIVSVTGWGTPTTNSWIVMVFDPPQAPASER